MIQTIIVLLVLVAAAIYIARRMWSTVRGAVAKDGAAGCGAGCGCSGPVTSHAPDPEASATR